MANLYKQATQGFQNVGGQIRQNLKAGQESPKATRADYSINPLKGARGAFMSAFKKNKVNTMLKKGKLTTNYSK